MAEQKVTLGDQLRGFAGSMFVTPTPVRKTYSQIVSKFNDTKIELQDLIADRESHVSGLEVKISDLENEKKDAIEEKGSALATLEFLDKFLKG